VPGRADAVVHSPVGWVDGFLGSTPQARPRRAPAAVAVERRPQLPQGNPQVGRSSAVTSVTTWG
jgi:hypothetical protein